LLSYQSLALVNHRQGDDTMSTKHLAALLLVILWASASQPVGAVTVTGSVQAGDAVAYRYNPGNGQQIFTLVWQTQGSQLFLDLYCELGLELYGWGTGWGKIDRIARLEVGTTSQMPRCLLFVVSVTGTSAFTLNALKTSSQGLTRQLTGTSNDSDIVLTLASPEDYRHLTPAIHRKMEAMRAMDQQSQSR
jgi:hypothetical protein